MATSQLSYLKSCGTQIFLYYTEIVNFYPSQKFIVDFLSAIDQKKFVNHQAFFIIYTTTIFLKNGLKFLDTAQENQNKNFCEGQKSRISV